MNTNYGHKKPKNPSRLLFLTHMCLVNTASISTRVLSRRTLETADLIGHVSTVIGTVAQFYAQNTSTIPTLNKAIHFNCRNQKIFDCLLRMKIRVGNPFQFLRTYMHFSLRYQSFFAQNIPK